MLNLVGLSGRKSNSYFIRAKRAPRVGVQASRFRVLSSVLYKFASVLFAVCFKVNILRKASGLYRQFGCYSFSIQWSVEKKKGSGEMGKRCEIPV